MAPDDTTPHQQHGGVSGPAAGPPCSPHSLCRHRGSLWLRCTETSRACPAATGQPGLLSKIRHDFKFFQCPFVSPSPVPSSECRDANDPESCNAGGLLIYRRGREGLGREGEVPAAQGRADWPHAAPSRLPAPGHSPPPRDAHTARQGRKAACTAVLGTSQDTEPRNYHKGWQVTMCQANEYD